MQDIQEVLDKLNQEIQEKGCDVADLKMSDYGIKQDEFETLAKNAKAMMGRCLSAPESR